MKKSLAFAAIAATVLFTGCSTQPAPTGINGKSKSSIKVGTDAHVFTLIDKIRFGGTTIVAEDGSSIIVSRTAPKQNPTTF
jgi:starvation-inducible outer membrane lipoprotein